MPSSCLRILLCYFLLLGMLAWKVTSEVELTTVDEFNSNIITEDFETSSELDNSTDISDVTERQLTIEDIDFGYGRECALKIIYTFRYLFDAITNELLQCMCFGFCPDTSQEVKDKILRDLKAKTARQDTHDDIPILVTYISVMVIGIIGNVLVLITVIFIFKANSVTNLFICSLSVADLIVVTICIPFRILDYVGDEVWRLGVGTCKFFIYIYFSSFMISVFTLTAMSLERYLVICHPMKAASRSTTGRARKVIAITWIVALVLASPGAVTAKVFSLNYEQGLWTMECASASADYRDWRGPLYMYLTVAIFAVPSSIMGFSYISTGLALWRSIKTVRQMKANSGENDKAKEKSSETKARIQVMRMLILIWILFVMTWGPDLIWNCIVSYFYDLDIDVDGRQATILIQTFNLLTMANSAMNPILYAFMSRQFRLGFAKVFMCVPCVKRRYKADPTSMATGVSNIRSSSSVNTSNNSIANGNGVSTNTKGKATGKTGTESKQSLKAITNGNGSTNESGSIKDDVVLEKNGVVNGNDKANGHDDTVSDDNILSNGSVNPSA